MLNKIITISMALNFAFGCNVIGYGGIPGDIVKKRIVSNMSPVALTDKDQVVYLQYIILLTSKIDDSKHYKEEDVDKCIENIRVNSAVVMASGGNSPLKFSFRCDVKEIGIVELE